MAAFPFPIGVLAERSGCNVPTIRYYEQIGLLLPAPRSAGGHRHYRESDLQRLLFIKRCRDFGFPIEQVRELVVQFENGDGNCTDVRNLAQTQLTAVRTQLTALRALEANLAAFVANCDSGCAGGANRECSIIDELAGDGPANVTELRRPT